MKRIILILSLVLVYSCAFLFVKIYAERSIISSGEPSSSALVHENDNNADNNEPEADVPEVTDANEPAVTVSEDREPAVEQLINKEAAGRAIMKLAAATRVEDTVPIVTTERTSETTAPTTTAAPATTTKTTTVTTAPTTEPPKTTTSAMTTDIDEDEIIPDDDDQSEDIEDEPDEEDIPDESVDIIDDNIDYNILTDEELQELLERLAASQLEQPQDPFTGSYTSGGSYKNDIVTIYDVTLGRLRTENAFDLVCEITNYEVGEGMEPEAIKAQAVAAYTYIKYYQQRGEYAELGTKSNPGSIIIDCVEAIDGKAIFYNGEYIMTPFSASQGGFSAASRNVWGGDLPYLQSVQNDFDFLDSKYYGLVTTYTVEELRSRIESKTDIRLSENYSEWIRVLTYNDSIYAGQLSIDGHTEAYINGRVRTITGHIFRSYVLNIRSTAFTVSYANGVFTFTTYGYGHGVGLSQIGANLYAKYGGYTYDQILCHYFTGVTVG